MKNSFTYDEVETILNEYKKGNKPKYIHTLIPHRSEDSITQVVSKHKKYLNGIKTDINLMKFFEKYHSSEKPQHITENTPPVEHTLSIDEAIEQLKNAIVQFIDTQVTEQSKAEITELKKQYETKLQDMQTVMVQAQKTSVIDMLRQKWGHI